jgi:hypothetical protein
MKKIWEARPCDKGAAIFPRGRAAEHTPEPRGVNQVSVVAAGDGTPPKLDRDRETVELMRAADSKVVNPATASARKIMKTR